MKKKLLLIGLDCATPQLVFDRFIEYLPNISRLMYGGLYGKLLSTDPPTAVPAWTSMMTGTDPGSLGVYGFRNRKNYSYGETSFATGLSVAQDRLWDILSKAEKRSIVIGIPQTYPPKPLNGLLASSFLAPDKTSRFTYPDSFKNRLETLSGGYVIDVEDESRVGDKDELLKNIYEMTDRRFDLVVKLMKAEVWDFFTFAEMGLDRIHHGFWHYFDSSHPMYEEGNPYENVIRDYYIHIDSLIGKILENLEEGTAVMIASDHGAKAMLGGIAINEWLIEKGYLALGKKPITAGPLTHDMVDWKKTRAWGEGGHYSRIHINVRGRELCGKVPPKDFEKVRDKLIIDLEGMCDENGVKVGTHASKPDKLYHKAKGIPPDIIAYLGNLDWHSVPDVGLNSVYLHKRDAALGGANHDFHGVFVFNQNLGHSNSNGKELYALRIYDVASTVLNYFDIPSTGSMLGRVIRG